MSPSIAGYYVLHPRGIGASTGAMPTGYVMVSRWVDAAEANLWMRNGGTYVPSQVGAGGRAYVTHFGAARAGTGPIRIDFGIPESALQPAGRPDWAQLFQTLTNTPIYNVSIHLPNSIPESKITGR